MSWVSARPAAKRPRKCAPSTQTAVRSFSYGRVWGLLVITVRKKRNDLLGARRLSSSEAPPPQSKFRELSPGQVLGRLVSGSNYVFQQRVT